MKRPALVLTFLLAVASPAHATSIASREPCCAMSDAAPFQPEAGTILVPEPATLILLGVGLSIFALRLRSVRRK